MNKVPHRSIVDLEAAPGKFGHKAAQGELPVPDPLHEKDMVLAGNGLGFVAAHLERRHAARLLEPPNPIDHRAGSDANLAVGAEVPSLLAGLIVDADGVPKEIKKI